MFSLFIMPKRRTFGHFLASSQNSFFLVEKEDMSSKRKAYGWLRLDQKEIIKKSTVFP